MEVRRVVVGEKGGQSAVVSDGAPPISVSRIQGTATHTLWAAEQKTSFTAPDLLEGREFQIDPPPGGTQFLMVEAGPGIDMPRHRTDTIDYIAIVSGEITLTLDDGEVQLRQGDCAIQRGGMHSWHNRGTEPCILAVTMVSTRSD
jgi:naringenin degradation protein FdeH